MARLIKIAEMQDLLPGAAAAFDIDGAKIAVFNVDGRFYAVGDVSVDKGCAEGQTFAGPIRNYNVVVAGNDIQLEL